MKVGDLVVDKSDGAILLVLDIDSISGDVYCYCFHSAANHWYFEHSDKDYLEKIG